MGGRSALVRLGRADLWAYVVEAAEGLRVRVPADEWASLGLHAGQRILVRRSGVGNETLFLAEVTETTPFVWLVMQRAVVAAN